MKLLQLANRVPWPLKDGGARGIYQIAKGYHANVSEYRLFCLNTKKHRMKLDELPEEFRRMKLRTADIDASVTAWGAFANLFSNRSYNVIRFYDAEAAQALADTLAEFQPDWVHLDGPFLVPYINVIRSSCHAKIAMRAHNVEHLIWLRMAEQSSQPLKKWYFRLLAQRLQRLEAALDKAIDLLLPISKEDEQVFRKLGLKLPSFVSPAGLDVDQCQDLSLISSQTKNCCFIGSLDWMPNQEALQWLLSELWPAIQSAFPDQHLWVAGRNMPEHFRQYHQGNVHILGEIDDATQFLAEKGSLLVPLVSGSGIRIKILEALSHGKAVVSSDIGVEGIDLTHGLHYLSANTTEQWVEAIARLRSEPNLAQRLGQEGRRHMKEYYDNDSISKHLVAYLNTFHVR